MDSCMVSADGAPSAAAQSQLEQQHPQHAQQHHQKQPLHAPYTMDTYGWSFNPSLSADENFNDLALAVSRNSTCDGGHMGTVLVGRDGSVMAMAVNSTLYDPTGNKSDVHAEANCLCACARRGLATEGCTIYITMPPCKNCFGLLQAAGISRIVFRRANRQEDMTQAAKRLGIEMVGSSGHVAEDASLERVKALWAHCPKPPKRPKLNPPEEQQQQQQLTGAVGGEAHGGGTAAAVAGRGDGAAVAQAKVQAATMSGAGENQAALSMDGKAAVSAMSGTGDA